jgi:oxygen-dependent protoporphyrinogen oxidase
VELERRYGSVIVGMLRSPRSGPRAKLAAFRDGMKTLPLRLARDLDVRLGVDDVRLANGLRVEWDNDTAEPKAVVLACPAYVSAGLTRSISPDLANLLDTAQYAPMLVAATSIDEGRLGRPLNGFGFLVPRSEKIHILGTLFSSSLFPNRAPPGMALLTSFVGGALEPDAIKWSEDRVWDTVTAELTKILGPKKGTLEPVRLFRQERAIPQYGIGHRKWLANVAATVGKAAGLFLTGSYLDGVSVPAAMEHGRGTADAVIEYVRR